MLSTSVNDTTTTDVVEPIAITFLPVAILVCVSIGFPLNFVIASVIIAQRRLHKPRHISWLGVTFSNLFALVTSVTQLLVLSFPQNQFVCMAFILQEGVPYGTLLFNSFLALLDRYMAISYPLCYKKKVTNLRIILAQIFGLVLISVLFKTFYLLPGNQLANVQCNEQAEAHGKVIVFTLICQVLLCVVVQVMIYLKTRTYLQQERQSDLSEQQRGRRNIWKQQDHQAETCFSITSRSTASTLQHNHFVNIGGKSISKLQLEATWILAADVISLCLISSPIFLLFFSNLFCAQDCTTFDWMIPYYRELVLVHSVYNPIIYMCRSKEFSTALRKKCCPRRDG